MLLVWECLLDVAIEKAEESNNRVNNVFGIIVILVLFFLFRVPSSYIFMSFMHPRSSLEWEFLNHVQVPTIFVFSFLCLMLQ